MSGIDPTKLLVTYAGCGFLVYIESEGFTRPSPVLYSIPLVVLAGFTIILNIESRAKYLTALSFLFGGLTTYSRALRSLSWASFGLFIQNILYFLSFQDIVRRYSRMVIAIVGLLVVAAGSLIQYGSRDVTSGHQASYARLAGSLLHLISFSITILNMFGSRTQQAVFLARIIEYIAQALLFLANEREF